MKLTLPHLSQSCVNALIDQGVEVLIRNGEDYILTVPDEEWNSQKEAYEASSQTRITLRGVTLIKRQLFFGGHIDAPKQYSTLEGGMVPSGVDLNQCHICGYWMDKKMNPSDERSHEYQCDPHYKWVTRKEAEAADAAEAKRREANQPPTFEKGEILIANGHPRGYRFFKIGELIDQGRMVEVEPYGFPPYISETWIIRFYCKKITTDTVAQMSDEVRAWAGL